MQVLRHLSGAGLMHLQHSPRDTAGPCTSSGTEALGWHVCAPWMLAESPLPTDSDFLGPIPGIHMFNHFPGTLNFKCVGLYGFLGGLSWEDSGL